MKKIKFNTVYEQADGWSKWTYPARKMYRMQCCDCGLVHDIIFKVVSENNRRGVWWDAKDAPKKYRVALKARRNKELSIARTEGDV